MKVISWNWMNSFSLLLTQKLYCFLNPDVWGDLVRCSWLQRCYISQIYSYSNLYFWKEEPINQKIAHSMVCIILLMIQLQKGCQLAETGPNCACPNRPNMEGPVMLLNSETSWISQYVARLGRSVAINLVSIKKITGKLIAAKTFKVTFTVYENKWSSF